MTEATNVEQRASGALKPVGWLCHDCGVFREHDSKPMGCGVCEFHTSKAFGYPPQPGTGGNWRPLWGRDAMAAVSLTALKACPVVGGGTMQQQADDIVTEMTGCRDAD